jgi:hypothetical protein
MDTKQIQVLAAEIYPLAASADNVTMTITISEGLVRYAFVREVTSREGELKAILDKLSRSGDQAAAVTDITLLASKTLDAFRRSLSFTLAHELAHLWVPTIDEREADCNGLATVMAERGSPDIGVFEAINDAVLQGHSAYWRSTRGSDRPAVQAHRGLASSSPKGARIFVQYA